MNYDITVRTRLEDEVLGFLIAYDDAVFRSKVLLDSHGLNDSSYFANAFNQDVFITMQKCWEHLLPADLTNLVNLRPDKYRNKEDVFDKKMFDTNLIMMMQASSFCSIQTFETKLWVLKQYVLMDYMNNAANDIVFGQWDFRDGLQVAGNIFDGYNILFEKLTKKFKKSESVVDKQKELYERKLSGEIINVLSGIESIDRFTGGWFRGELIITAARPGMGKTTMALIMAIVSAFYYNKKIIFWTLEMPKVQLMNKIAAYQLKLDYHKIKNFEYDRETMDQVFNFYKYLESEKSNLIIIDKKEVSTVSGIDAKVKELKPDQLIVDYLQLAGIESGVIKKAGNREQEIAYISKSLKGIALDHDIPVLALSQLSRSIESRPNKRPTLSDLRESGAIEQDADIVIFYYRDAYYKELLNAHVADYERWNLEVSFAKGRDLGTKTLYLNANYITYEVKEGFLTAENSMAVPLPP